jgi:hypothetical protein
VSLKAFYLGIYNSYTLKAKDTAMFLKVTLLQVSPHGLSLPSQQGLSTELAFAG